MKKLFSFLLVLLCLTGVSCSFSEFFDHSILENFEDDASENEEESPVVSNFKQNFTLARYGGEKLNPYTSQSRTNRDLLSICYEGLVVVGENLTASPAICESFEISGNSVTFYISENAFFSDGTKITASDCVYSYAKADSAGSVYQSRFSIITGYSEIDSRTFRIWFSSDNIYNVNLANIPIIKAGSDVSAFVPTGSGAFSVVRDVNEVYLVKNEYHDFDENGIDIISIVEVYDPETLLYNINYGKVHASYADLSDGNSSYRGNVELISFTTNNFVFAVVNKNSPYFSNFSAVKALTYAVSRKKIADEILAGTAASVWYPFNPDWILTKNAALNADIYSSQTAHELFSEANLILSGVERVFNGAKAELTIIVNQENLTKVYVAESIAKDLEELGFFVTVRVLGWTEFYAAALDGSYDILITETTLFPNMDINVLLQNELLKAAIYKPTKDEANYSEEFLLAVSDFYAGNLDMRTFLNVFQNELPFIPLYFSGGALALNRSVSIGLLRPSFYDLFSNISFWLF